MNSTTIRIVCSGCGLRLRVDSQHSGQKFRCPKCQTVQVATTQLPTTVEYVPPPVQRAPAFERRNGNSYPETVPAFAKRGGLFSLTINDVPYGYTCPHCYSPGSTTRAELNGTVRCLACDRPLIVVQGAGILDKVLKIGCLVLTLPITWPVVIPWFIWRRAKSHRQEA